jgi:hypothetical protein
VGQVVDVGEPAVELPQAIVGIGEKVEIDVVDRALVTVMVDEGQARSADALDRWNVHFALRDIGLDRGRAEADRALMREFRVLDAEGHRAGAGAVIASECLGVAAGLGVDDEVDLALAVERHVLALMLRDRREAHFREQLPQQLRVRRRIFDELEAVGAHRVREAGGGLLVH